MDAVEWIWLTTMVIVVIAVVPLAIVLLHRTLRAARSIRRYLDEMLTAGVGIASHTASIGALDDTIGAAGSILKVVGEIRSHSSAIATLMAARAARGSTS